VFLTAGTQDKLRPELGGKGRVIVQLLNGEELAQEAAGIHVVSLAPAVTNQIAIDASEHERIGRHIVALGLVPGSVGHENENEQDLEEGSSSVRANVSE